MGAQALLRCMAFAAVCLASSAAFGEPAVHSHTAASEKAVVQAFRDLGLAPAGERGYVQAVRYREQLVEAERSDIRFSTAEAAAPLALGQDLILDLTIQQPHRVQAGLVFVGYGLPSALGGRDDFGGQDLRGKIAVYVDAAPMFLTADAARNARALANAAAERAGAVGLIAIAPSEEWWAARSQAWESQNRYLADSALQATRAPQLAAALAPAAAERLFSTGGHDLATILAAARAGRPLPRFALSGALTATIETRARSGSAQAIVAKLPGRDPFLARNSVVLSASADDAQALVRLAGEAVAGGATHRTLVFALLPEALRSDLAGRALIDRLGAPQDTVVAAIHIQSGLARPPALSAAGESSLGETARAVAGAYGLQVGETPEAPPVAGLALAGAPVLGVQAPDAPGFLIALAREVADASQRPSWRLDSPFAPPAPRAQDNVIAPLEMPVGRRPQRLLPSYSMLKTLPAHAG